MQKLSLGLIVVGVLIMLLGAAMLIGAYGAKTQDPAALSGGGSTFSVGVLMISAGLYTKSRATGAPAAAAEAAKTEQPGGKTRKCAVCGTAASVVRCTIHPVTLCAGCLAKHDTVDCYYLPASRRSQSMAAGAWR